METTNNSTTKYPDCWLFDINRRVYRRNEKGVAIGGPIWREHWVKLEIVGETTRSWVTSCDQKVPKKGSHRYVFSEEDIDLRALVEARYLIADRVNSCTDRDKLKQIADILNFDIATEA